MVLPSSSSIRLSSLSSATAAHGGGGVGGNHHPSKRLPAHAKKTRLARHEDPLLQLLFECPLEALCCDLSCNVAAILVDSDGECALSPSWQRGRGRAFLFEMACGVLQGCPLSGTLFFFACNCSVKDLEVSIEQAKMGWTRACADNIGCLTLSRRCFPRLGRISRIFMKFSGLTLKPSKCKAVPL